MTYGGIFKQVQFELYSLWAKEVVKRAIYEKAKFADVLDVLACIRADLAGPRNFRQFGIKNSLREVVDNCNDDGIFSKWYKDIHRRVINLSSETSINEYFPEAELWISKT